MPEISDSSGSATDAPTRFRTTRHFFIGAHATALCFWQKKDYNLTVDKPIVYAFLTADRVLREEGSHKFSVIGIFSNFILDEFPGIVAPWYIFISMVAAGGDHIAEIRISDSDGVDLFPPLVTKTTVDGEASTYDIVVPVNNLEFKHEGIHGVRFAFDGEELIRRAINVSKNPKEVPNAD